MLVSSVWLCSPLATWERDERSGRRAQSPKSSRTEALRQLAGGSQKLLVSEKWGLRPRPLEMARSLCQSTSALGGGEDAQLRLTTPTPLLHWLGGLSPASLAWEQGAFPFPRGPQAAVPLPRELAAPHPDPVSSSGGTGSCPDAHCLPGLLGAHRPDPAPALKASSRFWAACLEETEGRGAQGRLLAGPAPEGCRLSPGVSLGLPGLES